MRYHGKHFYMCTDQISRCLNQHERISLCNMLKYKHLSQMRGVVVVLHWVIAALKNTVYGAC